MLLMVRTTTTFTPIDMAESLGSFMDMFLSDRIPAYVIGKMMLDNCESYEKDYGVPPEDIQKAIDLLGES